MTWVTPEHLPPEDDPNDLPQAELTPSPAEPTSPPDDAALAEAAAESGLDAVPAEPMIDPLEDTSPRAVPVDEAPEEVWEDDGGEVPLWRRAVGLAMLLAAAMLTFVAGLMIALPLLQNRGLPSGTGTAVPATSIPATATQTIPVASGEQQPAPLPTLSPEQAAALLSTPPFAVAAGGGEIPREQGDPFTIIPDRPRGEVLTYTVQSGDTITAIAERFGLQMDTIAWSNSRDTVFALRPGSEMYILPVDGVYHQVLEPETIQEIAARYGVDDPYTVINSEFNNLFGSSPDAVLPSGTRVVVPGGTSTYNDWQYNPVVERSGSGGSGGSSEGGFISFAPGEPGSCGRQANPGATGGWAMPIAGYSWTRGFTSFHTGVDLASTEGASVFAASPGRVIYVGWNNWGYGNLIVLAHGPFTTLYGHLSSYNVGCGQMVSAGQLIGGVGSTGNSSGPHLHFEIRYNDIATDPVLYFVF